MQDASIDTAKHGSSAPRLVCPALVGRDAESATIAEGLRRARDRCGALFLVTGDAGTGKTRLALDAAVSALEEGFTVFTGRATPSSTLTPYRPLIDALGASFGWNHESQAPVGDAVFRLIQSDDRGAGGLLVLEDLQWADPETISALGYIADRITTEPIVCVATMRSDQERTETVSRLAARPGTSHLELSRLTAPDVERMATLCVDDRSLPRSVVELLHRYTDGTPFLVEELLTDWARDVLPGGSSTTWSYPGVVRHRLASLPTAARCVATTGAVLGVQFDNALLSPMTGLSPATVVEALRHARDAGLVVGDASDADASGFVHALTRDAVLAAVPEVERHAVATRCLCVLLELHPKVEEKLCELAADLAESVGASNRAAKLLLEAAWRAFGKGALATAESALSRAAQHAEHGALWQEVQGRLSRAREIDAGLARSLPARFAHLS